MKEKTELKDFLRELHMDLWRAVRRNKQWKKE